MGKRPAKRGLRPSSDRQAAVDQQLKRLRPDNNEQEENRGCPATAGDLDEHICDVKVWHT